jgi:hypothetical protein
MNKKLISLLLGLGLTVGLATTLVACGGGGDSGTTPSESPSPAK